MSKPRVLLFHNVVAPYRHALFRELAQQVDLRVLYATRATVDRQWSTHIPAGYHSEVLGDRTFYAYSRPLTVCRGLLSRVRAYRPDAIVSVLTRANAIDILRLSWWAAWHDVPLLLWVGDIDDERRCAEVPGMVTHTFAWMHRRILSRAGGFICYSQRSVDWLTRRGHSGPLAVGTQVLDPPPTAARTSVQGQPPRFQLLLSGKLEERKGVQPLLDALARLSPRQQADLCLTVAGAGPLQRRVAERCPSAIKLRMLGFIPREQLFEEYRRADTLILPSLHDPWGNVINEAMAQGTPVIASRQCGGSELAAQAGWVVDAFDVSSIQGGILDAMSQARAESVRRRAVEAEACYRPAQAAERIVKLVSQVCRRRARGG